MQKTYSYDSDRYRFKVVIASYIMIAVVIILTILFILRPTQYIYLLGIGAAIYGILNTYVFKSYPRDVVITDDFISFVSFGEIKYDINQLTTFNVREFANAQFFIRVEDRNGKRGRYWVFYYYFSDREEMINELYYIEKKIHPKNIKFRGREDMFNIRPCYHVKADDAVIDPYFQE